MKKKEIREADSAINDTQLRINKYVCFWGKQAFWFLIISTAICFEMSVQKKINRRLWFYRRVMTPLGCGWHFRRRFVFTHYPIVERRQKGLRQNPFDLSNWWPVIPKCVVLNFSHLGNTLALADLINWKILFWGIRSVFPPFGLIQYKKSGK